MTLLSIHVVVIVLETICKALACKGSRRGIFDIHHLQCLCVSFLLTERHRFLSESERENIILLYFYVFALKSTSLGEL